MPGKTSSLCSMHFTEDDFTRPLNLGVVKKKKELKRDEVGVCVFPSKHISRENCDEEVPFEKEQRTANGKSPSLSLLLFHRSSIFDLVLSFLGQILFLTLLLFWFVLIDREICEGKTERAHCTRE